MRLAKWNKDGSVAWSKTYDAQYTTAGSAVVSDPSGGAYFGGAVEGTLALGDGKSVQGASLNPKAFVAKVGATGVIAWALTLTDNDERIENLVLSGSRRRLVDAIVLRERARYRASLRDPRHRGRRSRRRGCRHCRRARATRTRH
jgi:hypothetical protein